MNDSGSLQHDSTQASPDGDELDILVRLMRKMSMEDAARWLDASNPSLDGESPAEAIRAGRKASVLNLIWEGPAA